MSRTIIGVMGPGENATPTECDRAYELGWRIARSGWVLLTGGRNRGVMEAASQGAQSGNGLTIGILPGRDRQGISAAVDLAIVTDMGNARNNINILSSHVIIACGMGLGTASEVALALKSQTPTILLSDRRSRHFFTDLAGDRLMFAVSPEEAIAKTRAAIARLAQAK
ncbi:MAG: cytochrome [Cyanobacteria bacterium SBLK]|nr:cytochrome [Cyanobacteria bacterium SBLK]